MKKIRSNTKTLTVDILLLLVIILVLSISAFAQKNNQQNQGQTRQEQIQTQPENPVSQRVTKLKKELRLTETQTAAVREILEKGQKQAEKDRETLKTNAVGLIEAAWERRKNTNAHIRKKLDDQQKEKFKKMTRMTSSDRELFDLIEGLLLDDDQAFKVKGILIKYSNKLNEWKRKVKRWRGRGRPTLMLIDDVNRLHAKKNQDIETILSKEQKNLFEQLDEHRQKELKERGKQSQERRKQLQERQRVNPIVR